MSSQLVTPGPYRATKLWNEVTRLFRSGMPLRKHRQSFRVHTSCFTATAAVDWLHQLLRSNSNFGPEVTRQQTVQLLKKFLKNHVIEDVKGRWGTEELDDNTALYRFPSTSPVKPIPVCPAPGSVKKSLSLRDKDGFFRFRTTKRPDTESLENIDPALQTQEKKENQPTGEQQIQRRELTEEDELEVWRDVTLTHLQRILGLSCLDQILDPQHVNPQNIKHNMTQVNKHGVVTLEDKTNDLPHWVLSAMKSLANWPKYDSSQPSYPGFERDVFKTVSDYFYSLPQPLLTHQLYDLFINVLVLCGCVTAPSRPQRGKRKQSDPPPYPLPSKTAASFRSTECLLLSLIRQGSCDEVDSPMREVFGSRIGQSRLSSLREGRSRLGGSCLSLSQSQSSVGTARLRPRSCSLETILDDSAPLSQQRLFPSNDSLVIACGHGNRNHDLKTTSSTTLPQNNPLESCCTSVSVETSSESRKVPEGLSRDSRPAPLVAWKPRLLRPCSAGSCLDIVMETREEVAVETAPGPARAKEQMVSSSSSSAATRRPGSGSTSGPVLVRRCLSSVDLSMLTRRSTTPKTHVSPPKPQPENRVQGERGAIEALQLCSLLLPPSSRRRLQLLLRMMSRISQNVDMPRLHHAIGTRTLMIHSFSGCVFGGLEDCGLDDLLGTRLLSFLLDHQQDVLSVPTHLLHAVTDHLDYLHTVQLPVERGRGLHVFCRQISGAEFEEQRVSESQRALEDLLELLLTESSLSDRTRKKQLRQFQKQYPDIYSRRFPPEVLQQHRPKIKPPLLTVRKSKAFSLRN